ncbi:MAG: hypothetical protein N2C12_03005, partial [Planctomycetales bacterium]
LRAVKRLKRAYPIFSSTRTAAEALLQKGSLNVVHILPELQPLVDQFDESYHFVGPVFIQPKGELVFPI